MLARALIACAVFTLWPVMIWAQTPQPDYDAWADLAARAETVIGTGPAEDAAFEKLRAEVSTFRSAFQTAQTANLERIATLQEQLTALGPVPSDTVEPDTIASRRSDLNAQLQALEVPRLRADEAYTRADGLISEIDSALRQRQADKIFSLDSTPLNPAAWPPTGSAVLGYLSALAAEVGTAIADPDRRDQLRQSLLQAVLFLSVGLLMIWRGSVWVERLARRVRVRLKRGRGVGGFVISLGQIVVPVAGIAMVVSGIDATDMTGQRGDALLNGLVGYAAIIMGGRWLSVQMFPKEGSRALMALEPSAQTGARRVVGILALILAFDLMIRDISAAEGASAAIQGVLRFPVLLLAAASLYRLAILLRHTKQLGNAADAPHGYGLGLVTLSSRLAVVVAGSAPVLAAIGYRNAADALIYPAIWSLALIGGVLVLQRLVRDFYDMLTGRAEATDSTQSTDTTDTPDDALLPVLISFALSVAAVPVLALIWGARVSDITEIWARFRAGFVIGETRISPTEFLTFALVFAVGYAITRLVQGAMRNTILPKTTLDAGGRNAVVSGLGYLGVFLAALAAITAAGLDLSNLAIVAGALSVGIGFGLQNIVSNFVSGIILLIERPISAGDWIEVGGHMGYVRDISVRSTRIETFDRTDVIVPNADLVSGVVTNWTRGNTIGRVVVPVGVAYGSDTRQVEDILTAVAREHPMVLLQPPPFIYFKGFGDSALDFEIRAILRDVNWLLNVTSDMNHEIYKRFQEAGIEIPFPQRDLWLRNAQELQPPSGATAPASDATSDPKPPAPDPPVSQPQGPQT